MYGVCLDNDPNSFKYLIADDYKPWKEIPQDCTTHTIAAGMWAVFPCRGVHPESLQSVNTRIWNEWLPNCREYRLGGNYSVEFYVEPEYAEIWVPVVKA